MASRALDDLEFFLDNWSHDWVLERTFGRHRVRLTTKGLREVVALARKGEALKKLPKAKAKR